MPPDTFNRTEGKEIAAVLIDLRISTKGVSPETSKHFLFFTSFAEVNLSPPKTTLQEKNDDISSDHKQIIANFPGLRKLFLPTHFSGYRTFGLQCRAALEIAETRTLLLKSRSLRLLHTRVARLTRPARDETDRHIVIRLLPCNSFMSERKTDDNNCTAERLSWCVTRIRI